MIAKWIEADEMKRKEKLFSLFQYVRWPYVDPIKLQEIRNQRLIVSNRISLPEIDNVFSSTEDFNDVDKVC